MKKIFSLLAFVLLLALAYGGTSYWFGIQAESRYRQLIESAQNINASMGVDVGLVEYQRGIFSSYCKISYRFSFPVGGAGDAPLELLLEELDEITHGPFPVPAQRSGDWKPGLGMAFVSSQLRVVKSGADKIEQQVTQLLTGLSLQSTTMIALNGTGTSRVVAPARKNVMVGGVELSWGGMTSEFQFGIVPANGLVGGLSVPELRFSAEKGSILLKDLDMDMDMLVASLGTGALTTGTMALGIGELKVVSEGRRSQSIFR